MGSSKTTLIWDLLVQPEKYYWYQDIKKSYECRFWPIALEKCLYN